MVNIKTNFNGGRRILRRQVEKLGHDSEDRLGNRWGFIRIGEPFGAGQHLRTAEHADLVSAHNDNKKVSGVHAVGTNRIKLNSNAKFGANVRGALGYIATGTGAGQSFYVVNRISDSEIEIFVVSTLGGFVDGGSLSSGTLQTALANDDEFELYFPGLAFAVDAANDQYKELEGVAQVAADSNDVGKHLYVSRSGRALCQQATGDQTALKPGNPVMVDADGHVAPLPGTVTVAALRARVGRAISGGVNSAAASRLIPVDLEIPVPAYSYNPAYLHNDYNEADIGLD